MDSPSYYVSLTRVQGDIAVIAVVISGMDVPLLHDVAVSRCLVSGIGCLLLSVLAWQQLDAEVSTVFVFT